jgi:hypothetical protein
MIRVWFFLTFQVNFTDPTDPSVVLPEALNATADDSNLEQSKKEIVSSTVCNSGFSFSPLIFFVHSRYLLSNVLVGLFKLSLVGTAVLRIPQLRQTKHPSIVKYQ